MPIQALTPPQDITWTRMLFSRDMIDTNFNMLKFPPKWRSTFAVYYYIVPEEETVDAYPNSRIVYLKLSCSITGWNPSEHLVQTQKKAYEAGTGDDLQVTLWEVIMASGWAETYWPCLGAIAQLAVYPNNKDGVSVEDYPYILDFEPKKRELYEAVTEGTETLSGSSDTTNITNGTTTVKNEELNGASISLGPLSVGATGKLGTNKTSVDQTITDSLKETRETLSRTTTSNQMYQLFNGYHLGTNRSLFVIAPRPHTLSSGEQIEGSLVNGERKLEGVQDIFLVVHMPKSLDGFCIQASLDTGHMVTNSESENQHLVITRRIAQSCGTFDENGKFSIKKLTESPQMIVGEIKVDDLPVASAFRSSPREGSRKERIDAVNNLNKLQSKISNSMLDKISAGKYKPKRFEETNTFKTLASLSARKNKTPIGNLISKNIITQQVATQLEQGRITTIGDLFSSKEASLGEVDLNKIKRLIVDYLFSKKAT